MNKYKIYFYDRDIKQSYPVTVSKEDINDLCKFLNSHIKRWNLEVINAQLLDYNYNLVGEVDLLPTEIVSQHFISSLPERLIAYNNFTNRGV